MEQLQLWAAGGHYGPHAEELKRETDSKQPRVASRELCCVYTQTPHGEPVSRLSVTAVQRTAGHTDCQELKVEHVLGQCAGCL